MSYVLDSGGVSDLAQPSPKADATYRVLRHTGNWPPVIPSVVLVECLTGDPGRDARVNQIVKLCEIVHVLPERLARRAASLRTRARRGSVVDAVVVTTAEPGGAVLTSDAKDIRALAEHAADVKVVVV
jgi:hypothetical protein